MQAIRRFSITVYYVLIATCISFTPSQSAFAQSGGTTPGAPTVTEPPTVPLATGLKREVYLSIPGGTLGDLTNNAKFPGHPDIVDTILNFEAPNDYADTYGARYSGYLKPTVTGNYTFYLCADDQAALFLSPSADPTLKRQIATEYSFNFPRNWVENTIRTNQSNISAPIYLEAGKSYYIEALHKEFYGGDCLGVAWRTPISAVPLNGSPAIPSTYLSPNPPPNQPPSVSLNAPAEGSVFEASSPIWICAGASDVDGTIKHVEFFAGTQSLGVSTQPIPTLVATPEPIYGLTWTNAAAGDYALTAVATDNSGLAATSAPIHIKVTAPTIHGLKREVYLNVPGGSLSNLTNHPDFPSKPDVIDTIANFETPMQYADNYGTRVSGYLVPPVTGYYTFYVCADDQAALFLSNDANPAHKTQIAAENTWSMSRTWVGFSADNANISSPIYLRAGRYYYIEALHKEGGGGDNLAVAWRKPGDAPIVNGDPPIPGDYLLPTSPANFPPTVDMASPYNVIEADAPVRISAWADDLDGTVAQVEFFAGEKSIGIATTPDPSPMASPLPVRPLYSVVWSNVPAGEYVFTALATDNLGLSSTSAPLHVIANPIPVVTIVATDPIASESGIRSSIDTATFVVTRTGPTNESLSVSYVIGGTAQNGVDYFTIPDGVLIPVGQYSARITIQPRNDALAEDTETVELTLVDLPLISPAVWPPIIIPPLYRVGEPSSAAVRIYDASSNLWPVVTIKATDPIASEPDSPVIANNGRFTVSRTGPITNSLNVFYAVGGTAKEGIDYKALPHHIAIPAGSTNASIEIVPLSDRETEGTETVDITLVQPPLEINSVPDMYTIGDPGSARVQILDSVAVNLQPVASIAQPCDGSQFSNPDKITLIATASDRDGTIATLSFFDGDTLIGTGTPLPEYSSNAFILAWDRPAAGTHKIVAKATDNLGAVGASSPIQVTVTVPSTNSELHVVSVYHSITSTNWKDVGEGAVVVDRPGKRVTLFLSSYESMRWHLTIRSNTTIEKVILGSSSPSFVEGLPAGVPVIAPAADPASPSYGFAIWLGFQIGDGDFALGLQRLHALTGMEISSYQGTYSAPYPIAFVVNSVSNDVRLLSSYPQPVALSSVPNLSFSLAFQGVGTTNLILQDYTLAGPGSGKKLIPATRIVPDASNRYYYGVQFSYVFKTDWQTGISEQMLPGTSVPEFSWPMDCTFDSTRNRILMVSLGGEGYLYAYNPVNSAWSTVSSMQGMDVAGMVYSPNYDAIYCVWNGGGSPLIEKRSPAGASLDSFQLPMQPFGIGTSGYRPVLVAVDKYLVLLLAPDPATPWMSTIQEERIYLIDPSTKQSWLTYRKVLNPANQFPAIQIVAPVEGETNLIHDTVQLVAKASDPDGWIKSVAFFANGAQLGSAQRSECGVFELKWTPPFGGSYSITAQATDNLGLQMLSRPVAISVYDPNIAPSIRITAPVDDSIYSWSSPITISVNASDSDGFINLIEFYGDGVKLGEQAFFHIPEAPPGQTVSASLEWTNPGPGWHYVNAIVTDDCGASSTDGPVSFELTQPPTCVVNVHTVDSYAMEKSPDGTPKPAIFKIHRSGDTSEDLTVWIGITGTAQNGVDYRQISDTVTIPAGKQAVRITVKPIDDQIVEGDETVVINVLNCGWDYDAWTYFVGPRSVAAAVIADNDEAKPPGPELVNGTMHLRFTAESNATYDLEVSTDLKTWTSVAQATAANGSVGYVDAQTTDSPLRFYRIRPTTAAAAASDDE